MPLKPESAQRLENLEEIQKCHVKCQTDGNGNVVACQVQCGCVPREEVRKTVGALAYKLRTQQRLDFGPAMSQAWAGVNPYKCPKPPGG